MRFMLLLKGDPPAGSSPSQELIDAMITYNEELAKAGVLLAADGDPERADDEVHRHVRLLICETPNLQLQTSNLALPWKLEIGSWELTCRAT